MQAEIALEILKCLETYSKQYNIKQRGCLWHFSKIKGNTDPTVPVSSIVTFIRG